MGLPPNIHPGVQDTSSEHKGVASNLGLQKQPEPRMFNGVYIRFASKKLCPEALLRV